MSYDYYRKENFMNYYNEINILFKNSKELVEQGRNRVYKTVILRWLTKYFAKEFSIKDLRRMRQF